MFWVHLVELFFLAWLSIAVVAIISRQTEHHRDIKAMTDVLCQMVGHLYPSDKSVIEVRMAGKDKSNFEYKTDDKPSFVHGDKPGDFRPMPHPDDNRPPDVQ